jgi:hypothetical protein
MELSSSRVRIVIDRRRARDRRKLADERVKQVAFHQNIDERIAKVAAVDFL